MILHRYVARRFLWLFLAVLGVFALFQGLLDLVDELRRFGGEASFGQVVQLTALKLPEGLYQILPLVMILSSIALFLGLARSSELVVIRAVGRSGMALLLAPVGVAFVIGVLTVAMMNPIVAATSKRYIDLSESFDADPQATLSIGPEGLWLRQGGTGGQAVIRAARANGDATTLYDVSIVTYAPDGPLERIMAETARLTEGAWELETVKTWPLTGVDNPETAAQEAAWLVLPTDLTQDSIRDRFGSPQAVPIWELPSFIKGLEEAGFSARRHTVWLQMELARPLFLTAMVLVAAAFTMGHTRLARTGIAVLTAVLLGFGLYYVRNFAQIMGETGQLNPVLAAWVPPLASVLLATGFVLQREDG